MMSLPRVAARAFSRGSKRLEQALLSRSGKKRDLSNVLLSEMRRFKDERQPSPKTWGLGRIERVLLVDMLDMRWDR